MIPFQKVYQRLVFFFVIIDFFASHLATVHGGGEEAGDRLTAEEEKLLSVLIVDNARTPATFRSSA